MEVIFLEEDPFTSHEKQPETTLSVVEQIKVARYRLQLANDKFAFVGHEVYGKLRQLFPHGDQLIVYGIPIVKVDRRRKQWRGLKAMELWLLDTSKVPNAFGYRNSPIKQ